MKADSFKIAKVFSNGGEIHYILPHFQREYAWERNEWETLLTDACAIHDELEANIGENDGVQEIEHFLGSLVVVNSGTVAGTMTAFKLVDGQQRLITISVLLCALKQLVAGSNLARKIAKLLINEDEQGDVHFKLLPTNKYGDREAYKAILQGKVPLEGESRIPAAFDHLYQQLKHRIERGDIQPDRFFFTLTNAFQVVFIELNQNESPYKIFESLNAKGKPLTQADLVRNYIAMCLPASGQEEVFCDHWAKIEERLQEKRTVGRSGIGELTAFLRHYLAMQSGVLCNEKHVYARFRDYMKRDFASPSAFVNEIKTLHEYAVLYDRLLCPERQPDASIREAMQRLDVLDISTAYPFLLAVSHACHTGEVSASEFAEALRLLENYLMRRFLAEEPTNYLNKMFPQLWRHIQTEAFLPSLQAALAERKYPSDTRIRQKLLTRPLYRNNQITRNQITFLLEQVNRHLSSGTGGYTVLNKNATIEHILPQNPDATWITELGVEYARYEEFVHILGNLTLVTQEWNSSLSNAAFAVKKAKLASHALRLNCDYFSQVIPTWNESAIQARSGFLIDNILRIWPRMESDGDSEQASSQETANFHPQVIEAVSRSLGVPLDKRSQKQYSNIDDVCRVVCSVSGTYIKPEYKHYWFAFSEPHYVYLDASAQGYVAFGCGTANSVILMPFHIFASFVPKLNTTKTKGTPYWHVTLYEKDHQFLLGQSGLENTVDVTSYLLPSK